MPRPKSPEGKRVPMTTRFSEPEAAEIDAARGNTDRSEWLRAAALAFLAANRRAPAPAAARSRNMAAPLHAPVPPVRTAPPKVPPAGKAGSCVHRIPAGAYCKTCGHTKT